MVVCASVLTLTALPSAADQATTAAKPDKIYAGTVVSVNPNGRTIEVKGLLFSKNFNLGENCAYVLWNKPAGAIGDLRAGEKVKIAYQDASGVLVADRIKQEPMTDQGMVKAIDPAAHTLTLRSGLMDKTMQIPDNCLVRLNGDKSGSLADVQPGYYVTVTYELPHGKPVAREIKQTGTTFTGELTAVDLGNRTVKAKSLFDTKRFHLADNCAIVINGKANGQLSDLKLGGQMAFSYEDVNGVKIVNRIANEPVAQESTVSRGSETTSAQPMYQ
jgi:Cu/Ag efflux protein CusF